MASKRFSILDDGDVSALEKNSKNDNTTRSTATWLKTFNSWAESRNIVPELSLFAPDELNDILRRFYAEVRKENGDDYEPDSLRVMQAALHRYLISCKYPKSIMSDKEFKSSRDVLEGKARMLRTNGKGKRPNAASALSREDENLLWDQKKTGCC